MFNDTLNFQILFALSNNIQEYFKVGFSLVLEIICIKVYLHLNVIAPAYLPVTMHFMRSVAFYDQCGLDWRSVCSIGRPTRSPSWDTLGVPLDQPTFFYFDVSTKNGVSTSRDVASLHWGRPKDNICFSFWNWKFYLCWSYLFIKKRFSHFCPFVFQKISQLID